MPQAVTRRFHVGGRFRQSPLPLEQFCAVNRFYLCSCCLSVFVDGCYHVCWCVFAPSIDFTSVVGTLVFSPFLRRWQREAGGRGVRGGVSLPTIPRPWWSHRPRQPPRCWFSLHLMMKSAQPRRRLARGCGWPRARSIARAIIHRLRVGLASGQLTTSSASTGTGGCVDATTRSWRSMEWP